jgi:hypothetical protein
MDRRRKIRRVTDTYSLFQADRQMRYIHQPPYIHTLHTMNRSGGEAFAKLAQQLNRARLQAQGGGGGGGGGKGGPGLKGFMAGGGLLAVLAGGGLVLNYSLFNGTSFSSSSTSSSLIILHLDRKSNGH